MAWKWNLGRNGTWVYIWDIWRVNAITIVMRDITREEIACVEISEVMCICPTNRKFDGLLTCQLMYAPRP
jgi:hypothetical protein